jgi:hypothetical protein
MEKLNNIKNLEMENKKQLASFKREAKKREKKTKDIAKLIHLSPKCIKAISIEAIKQGTNFKVMAQMMLEDLATDL